MGKLCFFGSILLVATLLSSLGAAQIGKSAKTYRRYSGPLKSIRIDAATGTITRGPSVRNRAPSTIADFTNVDLGGFVGADTGNGFCEWVDAGKKGYLNNRSDLANTFVFAYCSAMLAPGSGGPGGSVKIGFYEGYAPGGTAPSTLVAAQTLTGLPGNTSSSSFFGGFRCYFAEACFLFECRLLSFSDGPIAYSWQFLDVGADGVLAGTWPFLSCVMSCSGTLFGNTDGQGMTDVLDEYCPPGVLRSSFSFGTTSGTFTSMAMEIREVRDLRASHTSYNASVTPNSDTLELVDPIVVDVPARPFLLKLRRNPRSNPGLFTVYLRAMPHPASNGVSTPFGQYLLAGPQLGTLRGVHDGDTGLVSTSVPAFLQNVGLTFAMQALSTAPGSQPRYSSAEKGNIGTHF